MRPISRELYPFEGKFFDNEGHRQHYLDEGRGDPVVMVHGNPSWSFYYRKLVLALRGNYRCIVPDHIGCGLSDKPGDADYDYTLQRRVDDLTRLLDHAGVTENVTLVVHDWGGMIGMTWAAQHPERIRRLVVLNTAAFHLPGGKSFPKSLWLARTSLGAVLIRGFNLFSRTATRMCVTRNPMSKEVRDAYAAPYDSWANRIATLRFVQDIALREGDPGYDLITDTAERLPSLGGHPMLVCWGMKDFVFDEHFLAEWERRFPDAQVHRFEDCGHYILEDAAEEIVPLVRDFLAEQSTEQAA